MGVRTKDHTNKWYVLCVECECVYLMSPKAHTKISSKIGDGVSERTCGGVTKSINLNGIFVGWSNKIKETVPYATFHQVYFYISLYFSIK